jgi:hypothetical protein
MQFAEIKLSKFTTRTLKVIVLPEGAPIYSDRATTIEIDDLAGGEFIVISQNREGTVNQLSFDGEDWETVKVAVDKMFNDLRIENEPV